MQEYPAVSRCFPPKHSIFFICPQSKQFIEMRQMIRRVRKFHTGNKLDQLVVPVPHRLSGMSRFSLMDTLPKDFSGLSTVIKNPFSVAPSISGEEKSHCKKFFPIWRRTISIRRSICTARPYKIIFSWSFLYPHISAYPFP